MPIAVAFIYLDIVCDGTTGREFQNGPSYPTKSSLRIQDLRHMEYIPRQARRGLLGCELSEPASLLRTRAASWYMGLGPPFLPEKLSILGCCSLKLAAGMHLGPV